MRVLDATFMIDYLDGVDAAKAYYESQGGADELWIGPVPSYAEVIVGVGNEPAGEVGAVVDALRWIDPYGVSAEHAEAAGRLAERIGADGPYLDGIDGLVAAVADELGAPVVTADADLTHEAVSSILDVHKYRD